MKLIHSWIKFKFNPNILLCPILANVGGNHWCTFNLGRVQNCFILDFLAFIFREKCYIIPLLIEIEKINNTVFFCFFRGGGGMILGRNYLGSFEPPLFNSSGLNLKSR